MNSCAKKQKKSSNHLILKSLYIKHIHFSYPFYPLTAGSRNIWNMWNIKDLCWNIRVDSGTFGTALDFVHVPNVPIGRELSH